jgi:hypothetical protein
MTVFRCYMTGADGHFRDVMSLEAVSDLEALTLARALPTAHAGFELWTGSRLVHREPVVTDAPIGEKGAEPIQISIQNRVGTGFRTVFGKLERIAGSVGESFSGTRPLAVVRSKEKRPPRG